MFLEGSSFAKESYAVIVVLRRRAKHNKKTGSGDPERSGKIVLAVGSRSFQRQPKNNTAAARAAFA